MPDTTTVRITINRSDAHQFLFRVGTAPHEINELPRGLVQLVFLGWDRPTCTEFHVDGVPFTGFHGEGQAFEPHRMCGDGGASLEIYCDREAHLYVIIDDATGMPNAYSSKSVAEFLVFERECARHLAE